MKQSLFPLIALTCVIVSFSQVNAAGTGRQQNEIEGTPSYNLKSLLYMLSQPKFRGYGNMHLPNLERHVIHNGETEEPKMRLITQRALKGVFKVLKKLKKLLKLLKKKK